MGLRRFAGALLLTGVVVSAATAAVRVPRVEGITVDGNGADWPAKAASVDVLTSTEGKFSAKDFDAGFRMAWDSRGLLILAKVHDPVGTEASVLPDLWQNDCIELFVADRVGGNATVQFLIAPGIDAKYPESRQFTNDRRPELMKTSKPELQIARTKVDGGYTMEILVPWSVLGRQAKVNDTLALQFYANSKDEGAPRRKLIFFPKDATHESSQRMHELVLTQDQGSRVQVAASAAYHRFRRIKVEMFGAPALVGKAAVVSLRRGGDDPMAVAMEHVTFAATADGKATAKATLPMPSFENPQVVVTADGQMTEPVSLPDPAAERAKAMLHMPVVFKPSVFPGKDFPSADFAEPLLAEDVIGEYQVASTYFNAAMEKVSTAENPGRYGAVVEIKTADGRTLRRFRTLYRTPKPLEWWNKQFPVKVQWPAEIGIDPAVAAEQAPATEDALRSMLVDGIVDRGMGAELFAALSEMKPGDKPADIMHDAEARDRAWWVKFKRKYYGTDQQFTSPIGRPTKAQTAAPVLCAGSDEEAGIKPGTREKLDELLKEWARDSGEPFTVCVSRNGVIIVDAAYGMRDGKPMTRETPSIVYSISKAISGTAFMMAVDQGLVSLDDTPSRYLQPFKDYAGRLPTLRQLFTHTAGLQGHWGDEMNDCEEVIAEYAPYLEIGQRHEYNGASLALGCKVLEQISGESLIEYYESHIFTPLEMANTTSTSCSWRTWTTAADLAKLGQMLLNGGSYGDRMFFGPASQKQMLPHKLEKELSPQTEQIWGIGLSWMNEEKTAYGHGSASSSTFRVDPTHGLVITMARNAAGDKHGEYHKKFIELIYTSIK